MSGTLLKWLVKEGDEVHAGDLVCEIQVENLNEELKVATMLIETWENGYIAKYADSVVKLSHAMWSPRMWTFCGLVLLPFVTFLLPPTSTALA